MRAAVINAYGDPSVFSIQQMPDPDCGDDDILVRIAAAGVNPIDWKIRKGMLRYLLPIRFPAILGYDFCGEVIAIGKNVQAYKTGDMVFGRSNYLSGRCYADMINVKAKTVIKKPSNLSAVEAASLPLAALTALQSLRQYGRMRKGQHVLIIGASGGVGIFAVQLAKVLGTHVTAVCGTGNVDFVKALGADKVIDYQKEAIFAATDTYDIVFDAVAKHSFKQAQPALTDNGRYVTTMPNKANILSWLGNPFRQQKCHIMLVKNPLEDLLFISQLIAQNRIHTVIDSEFALEDVAKAHERSESGHARGKIVLTLG